MPARPQDFGHSKGYDQLRRDRWTALGLKPWDNRVRSDYERSRYGSKYINRHPKIPSTGEHEPMHYREGRGKHALHLCRWCFVASHPFHERMARKRYTS